MTIPFERVSRAVLGVVAALSIATASVSLCRAADPTDVPPRSTEEIASITAELGQADVEPDVVAIVEGPLAEATADERVADEALQLAATMRAEADSANVPAATKASVDSTAARTLVPADATAEFEAWQARLPVEESLAQAEAG